jgi:hypothetical protein
VTEKLHLVDPKKDRLRRPRFQLLESVRRALSGDVAGYALVVWDRDGRCGSWVRPCVPLDVRILPAVIHDVLQQHTILDMADDNRFRELPGPEDDPA